MVPTRKIILVALLAAGCATSSSVKQQVDPLAERIAKMETRQAALEQQQVQLKTQLAEMGSADQAHQTALTKVSDDVQGLRTELAATSATAKNAAEAADEARAATARAETAASMAAKSFELQQKKGK